MRKGWEDVNSIFFRRRDGKARILLDTARVTDPEMDWKDTYVPAVVGDFVCGEVEYQLVIPVRKGDPTRALGKMMRLLDEEVDRDRLGKVISGRWSAGRVKGLKRTHGMTVPLGSM